MTTLDKTLQVRGKHYEGPGGYTETASTSQILKNIFRGSPNWDRGNLTPAQRESLDMIANKLARILNGNAQHADSWHDLAGYATLAEKACYGITKPELLLHSDGEVAGGQLGKSWPVMGCGGASVESVNTAIDRLTRSGDPHENV